MPSPIPVRQHGPAKCQKWVPSAPDFGTGPPSMCGNEAFSLGSQNAQLRGHWAKRVSPTSFIMSIDGVQDECGIYRLPVFPKPAQILLSIFISNPCGELIPMDCLIQRLRQAATSGFVPAP
jgi:hypothetical protein